MYIIDNTKFAKIKRRKLSKVSDLDTNFDNKSNSTKSSINLHQFMTGPNSPVTRVYTSLTRQIAGKSHKPCSDPARFGKSCPRD